MESLFFGVPHELFRDQIFPFLQLKDLARVDSATLHRALRKQLLDKLINTTFDSLPIDIDTSVATWLGLRRINLRLMRLDTESSGCEFENMTTALSQLTSLDLSGCTALEVPLFAVLRDHCRTLKTLIFKDCKQLPNNAIMTLGPAMHTLTTLDLADSGRGEGLQAYYISQYCCGTALTTLRLGGCSAVDDMAVSILAVKLPCLTDLDLGSTAVGDPGLLHLATHCTALRYLDVQCCNHITNTGVLHLTALGATLWELNFGHCHDLTDDSMLPLVSACPELRFYGICHCEEITEQTIEALAENNAHLNECDLSYTTIGGELLAQLAATCPGLLHLNLSYCNNMSAESMVVLIRICGGLQSLDLTANTTVTTAVTTELTQGSTHLEELSLCYCGAAVTNACVAAIALRCPRLRALNLGHCTAVTDEAVAAVAVTCTGLQFLDLTGCVAITDASLRVLQEHCTGLQALEVIQCKQVTMAAIDRMIEETDSAVTY